jgi:hypothetical protein
MSDTQEAPKRTYWLTAPELPQDIFDVWRKPDRAISPVSIVATVDADGTPRTAPFGSLRAVTPRVLRLGCVRAHDTYANLCRNGRVSVALVSPGIAVSVRGRARVVRERMKHDEQFAVLEIDIEQVKNDMVYRIVIESGIMIAAREQFKPWYEAAMAELEATGEL